MNYHIYVRMKYKNEIPHLCKNDKRHILMKTNKNSTNYMNNSLTLKIKQRNDNVSTTSGRDSLKCSQRRVNNFLIVFTDVLITIWSERELNSLIIYKIVSFEFCPSQIQVKFNLKHNIHYSNGVSLNEKEVIQTAKLHHHSNLRQTAAG